MPRSLRIVDLDSWHHVTLRGADRQDVFTDDCDRLHAEHLLGEIADRFGVETHAYCFMSNHLHLLEHCTDGRLSEALQYASSVYASRYNWRHGRTGPLFGGRFHSTTIESTEQLLQTSRYIHRNPLAFLGESMLAAYRWSSLGVYLGRRPAPPWLQTSTVLDLFGGSTADHRAYVMDRQPTDPTPSGQLLRPTRSEVEHAVCSAAGTDPRALHRTVRGERNDARLLTILLLTELRVATTEHIVECYGFTNPSSVRNAARRARVLEADDPSFARLRRRVEELLLRRVTSMRRGV
jgi:REP element-mobilizing transposase RayT